MQVPTKLDPNPDILKFFSLVGLFQKKRQVPERQKRRMLSEPEFLSYTPPILQDVLLWPREGSPKVRTNSAHFYFFSKILRFLNFRSDQSGYGGNIYSKWKRQFRIGVHGKHNWTEGFHFPGHQGCHMSFQNRILEMQCPRPLVRGCTSLKASN